MIDAIVFPKIQGDKPPPNYKIAEYYLAQDRIEDAESEFRTILKNHRKESQAYLGLIRLLLKQGNHQEGEKVFQKARRHLRNQPDVLNEIEMEWFHLRNQ